MFRDILMYALYENKVPSNVLKEKISDIEILHVGLAERDELLTILSHIGKKETRAFDEFGFHLNTLDINRLRTIYFDRRVEERERIINKNHRRGD